MSADGRTRTGIPRFQFDNPRSTARRAGEERAKESCSTQLSYVRSSLGDWNRTSGLVDPNHALSLLSYTQIEKIAVPNGQK